MDGRWAGGRGRQDGTRRRGQPPAAWWSPPRPRREPLGLSDSLFPKGLRSASGKPAGRRAKSLQTGGLPGWKADPNQRGVERQESDSLNDD